MAALHQGAPDQMTWLEHPLPWLRPAYCFASVIVWTENKNVTIPDRFICFILTVKQSAALAACVLRATTRLKRSSTFLRKKVNPRENPGSPMPPSAFSFCGPNVKSWLRPWLRVAWLEDFLTSKWPGSFTVLAPPLHKSYITIKYLWSKLISIISLIFMPEALCLTIDFIC